MDKDVLAAALISGEGTRPGNADRSRLLVKCIGETLRSACDMDMLKIIGKMDGRGKVSWLSQELTALRAAATAARIRYLWSRRRIDHTLFVCCEWMCERNALVRELGGVQLSLPGIVRASLNMPKGLAAFQTFARLVMREKKKDEKDREWMNSEKSDTPLGTGPRAPLEVASANQVAVEGVVAAACVVTVSCAVAVDVLDTLSVIVAAASAFTFACTVTV
ncbi:hypothetical protein M0804_014102 [Polistes exclamans]|nr:hypothetical protein M0804_014102 [Polistes exclamans]